MRTLLDLTNTIIKDVDENTSDVNLKEKIEGYVNRCYMELAKRERFDSLPVVLQESDEPETYPENDEFLIAYAKYLYFQAADEMSKAEIFKRDYESMDLKKTPKTYEVITER
jgi:hypothetical protein